LLIGLPFLNALEFGASRRALRRWRPPAGTFTPGWYGGYGAAVGLGLGVGFIARYDFGRTDFGGNRITYGRRPLLRIIGWNF
jgi:hypothetical protein